MVARSALRVAAFLVVFGLAGCAGVTGNIAPPPQPTPASVDAVVTEMAVLPASPTLIWEAGDWAARSTCDAYLNDLAQRNSNFGLASSAAGTSSLAAAGLADARANPVAAGLASAAGLLAQQFIGDFRSAGALPYGAETTRLIQDAQDAYEAQIALHMPATAAQAMSDVEGLHWQCTPAGAADLVTRSIGSAQVSAAAMSPSTAMLPTSPSRPRISVNGR